MNLTRPQALKLLKWAGHKMPPAEEVKRLGQHEFLMPTGAKVKVWASHGRGGYRLGYRLDGYTQGGTDLRPCLQVLGSSPGASG